jgi:polypeptide N-acetylgalactosaminyltransferase
VFIVDDGSDVEWLHAPLEEYVRIALPDKVKILRLSHRQGLVQARLKGARAATGDVLIFLDSHVEATTGCVPAACGPACSRAGWWLCSLR